MNSQLLNEIQQLFTEPNLFRSVLILIGSMLLAYLMSHILAKLVIRAAQLVSARGDSATSDQQNLRYRQIETYLSIAIATMRVAVVAIVGYISWRALSPLAAESQASNGLAAIGAGTFFIVFAGQTLGLVLRDVTTGSLMITEGWFHVGDYIKVEPFMDVAGVVERFTLRSTRLRALNGEIIWIHNQNITGVHVTPRGVRTISVELFVKDKERALVEVKKIIDTIPRGKTMLAQPLKIASTERWTGGMWRMTVTGKTPPGREWLIESYFFEALKAIDEGRPAKKRLHSLPPLVHMADSDANKRFNRAVRVSEDDSSNTLSS